MGGQAPACGQGGEKKGRNTSPGPDGISLTLWKALGEVGIDALFDVAEDVGSATYRSDVVDAYSDQELTPGEHSFNLGSLVCIPKKPL